MTTDILGLGLESSCDETAVSLVKNGREVLSNKIFSQIELHREYYGVVPEIASRAHLEVINILIDEAFKEAGLSFKDIDYVAATHRPGLIGSLLIALQSAKVISSVMNIPLIAVNHLEAHLYAPFLEGRELIFPFIGLLVSGGNTVLFEVRDIADLIVIGKTVDDAVGEAFDKVAKFLDIGYPGGPAVEKLAAQAQQKRIILPKILTKPGDERFSYSGIKTAVINYFRSNPDIDRSELVYSFQERALEILVRRSLAASRKYGINRIVVAGGVAANGRLRELFADAKGPDDEIIFASPHLCTDNAAMVSGVAYHYFKREIYSDESVDVYSRM